MIALLFVIGLIFGTYIVLLNEQGDKKHKVELEALHIELVSVSVKPTKTKQTKQTKQKKETKKDPLFDEAKNMLVNMGYTATEAKDLLQGVSGSNVQDYINQAMQKVKI